MVKMRDAEYCNLKLLTIFLVIYGHMIETYIDQNSFLMMQYRWIYLFHMPMFSFLFGLFLKDGRMCLNRFVRMLALYGFLQTASVVFGGGTVEPLTPCWHLWYLLSGSIWALAGWIGYRFFKTGAKFLVLIGSVLIGCASGYVPGIGREFSLSRTLVFFPYFWAGLMCDSKFRWEKLRTVGALALGIVIAVMANAGEAIPVDFLYHAEPFGGLRNGFRLRLLCYLLSGMLCLFALSFSPGVRFPFTEAGANTMLAYLVHAPIVWLARESYVHWGFCLLFSALLLYVIHRILKWYGEMYGIVPSKRRGCRWRRFKRSTRNTPDRSIGSCCP